MEDCNFSKLHPNDPIRELVSPLIAVSLKTGKSYACGTAFVAGFGFAFTAAHVITDFLRHFGDQNETENIPSTRSFDLLLYIQVDGSEDFIPLKALSVSLSTVTDIAVMHLAADPDLQHVWKLPMLQLLPPRVGEKICGVGYPSPHVKRLENGTYDMTLESRTTLGTVLEVYPQMRDSVRMPFPSFMVDARFDGSMSGGPVFSPSGSICGIICSSIPADSLHPTHTSYVCSLWPSLITTLATEESPNGSEHHILADYFETKRFSAIDFEQVNIVRNHDGKNTAIVKKSPAA